eukprot:XP_025014421.1 uncharacterized protein LOC112536076 [Ricinus communis]
MEESEVFIRRKHSGGPLLPPKFGSHIPRHASFLEQKLLPGIRSHPMQSQSNGKSSSTAQLTIFYAGEVNVYDNIPADKAQAIMLLAGESCVSKPMATEKPKAEVKKPTDSTSACKLQTDLPIARKLSLQHFLEKRRRRRTVFLIVRSFWGWGFLDIIYADWRNWLLVQWSRCDLMHLVGLVCLSPPPLLVEKPVVVMEVSKRKRQEQICNLMNFVGRWVRVSLDIYW